MLLHTAILFVLLVGKDVTCKTTTTPSSTSSSSPVRGEEYVVNVCPPMTPQQDFNMTAFSGTWFEIWRLPAKFEKSLSCVTVFYNFSAEGDVVVWNRAFNTTTKKYVTGNKYHVRNVTDGTFNVTFDPRFGSGVFWMLGTDYVNYAVISSCNFNSDQNNYSVYMWIMNRSTNMSDESLILAKKVLTKNKLLVDEFLEKTDQVYCPKEDGDN